MKYTLVSTLALLVAVVTAPARADDHAAAGQQNLIEVAEAAGNFNTLLTAIEAAGLTETLEDGGPFTVFAPTDEAFAALPEGTLESLLADPAKLKEVLTYHVVEGENPASAVTEFASVETLQGGELPVSTEGGVKIGDANVVQADIEASNGVIHVIDQVLVP